MPMGRHRHAINVRTDGLASVLGSLARDPAVQVALLVDVDSGMVLDGCGPRLPAEVDQEPLGAAHGELAQLVLGPAFGIPAGAGRPVDECEIVARLGDRWHLVLRRVPDPFGDRLALSVLVTGPPRAVRRVRRRLRVVSAAALTAGPTVCLRPVQGSWRPGASAEPVPPQVRPPPRPAGSPSARPAVSDGPVGGSALAALDARGVTRVLPAVVALGPADAVPGARVPDARVPGASAPADPRPAPPSALPPPAQRNPSG